MKGFSIFILFFVFSITSFAQKAPIKWGKVDQKDLKMKVYEPDTSAGAVILCDYGDLEFDLRNGDLKYKFTHHRRIKILKKSDFHRADLTIPYYSKDDYEELKGLKVQIFSPDGDKESVSKKDFFEEKKNEYWTLRKVSVPKVQEGSVIEYQYTIVCESVFELREWFFEHDIPVRWSEYRVAIPEWYHYVSLNHGVNKLRVEQREVNASLTIPQMRATAVGSEQRGYQQIRANVLHAQYIMENAPALKKEAYITTMDDYRTHIRFQLQSIKYPYSVVKPVMSTWPKVAKDLLESNYFGDQFLKKKNYKKVWEVVEPEVKKLKEPAEIVDYLYAFINKSMEWNGYYSRSVEKSLNDCFKKKTGRSGELNLMLLALLKEAGIDAYPVLISTRGNGKMIDLYPLLDQFNHVLVYLELDDKPIFLDSSNPFRPINYPRISSLNSKGWVVIKGNPQWIDFSPPVGADTYVFTVDLDEEGMMSGKVQCKHEGYSAANEREEYNEDKKGGFWKERLQEKYPDIVLDSINFEEVENINSNFIANMNFEIPELAQVSGDFIYLSPMVYTEYEENPFKSQTRSYPVDIPYPFKEQVILTLNIPKGYIVEEVPEAAKIVLPNKGGKFQYFVSQKENSVQIISRLRINQLQYSPEEYLNIKNFFDLVLEKQTEQIILKKKS